MTKKIRRKPIPVKTGHTLVKADIVDNVREATGLTVDEAKRGVEGLISLLKRGLVEDGAVLISSFGKFEARLKKPRPGRNPKTGEKMTLSERVVATFKLSPAPSSTTRCRKQTPKDCQILIVPRSMEYSMLFFYPQEKHMQKGDPRYGDPLYHEEGKHTGYVFRTGSGESMPRRCRQR